MREATQHHSRSKTYSGRFLRPHKPWLTDLIGQLGIKSALDYGCGKGAQYSWVDPLDGLTLEQAWGFEVAKFDPCWPEFAELPQGQFDLVICTHTLGSIPTRDLPWVIERLHRMTRKAVFIAEKIGPIKKGVHGDRKGFVNDWGVIDWLDVIAPHVREGVETHLSVVYKSPHGKFTGRFLLQ